jgi:hypothetical protein
LIGRYDVLEVETRGPFKGPRVYDFTGLPLHHDNQSVFKERIYVVIAITEALYSNARKGFGVFTAVVAVEFFAQTSAGTARVPAHGLSHAGPRRCLGGGRPATSLADAPAQGM